MRLIVFCILLVAVSFTACAQEKELAKEDIKSTEQKVSYAIGKDIGKNLKMQGIDIQLAEFMQGIKNGLNDKSYFTEEELTAILTQFQQDMMAKRNEKNKLIGDKNQKEGEEYLAANAAKEGVITTESGLQYKVIKSGSGPKPAKTDRVKVHYTGTYINGEKFDSSYDRNEPMTFAVTGVIPGWTEALLMMSPGDKWELAIPYNIAYGANGKPPVIEPYKTLLFEVELLEIVK